MLRWLRRIVIGLLVLVLLAVIGVGVFAWTLPRDHVEVTAAGELVIAEAARGTWQVGTLEVETSAEGITISQDGRTVWANDPGTSFLSAATGEVDVEEHRGYFWPDVQHDGQWVDQHVESVTQEGDRLVLAGAVGDLGWTATVAEREAGGAVLIAEVEGADALTLTSGRTTGVDVHGFGEQFDDFDLDGRLVPILAREQGVGRGEQPLSFLADLTNRSAAGDAGSTYAAWASFVTDDLRGVALDPERPESHAFAVADLRADDRVGLEVWAPTMTVELTSGDTPAALIAQRHTTAPTLPEWTQDGAIVGMQGGTDDVRRHVAALQESGTEISGVWLQDWSGQRTTSFGDRLWWTWQLDEERYPDWDELVADLTEQGIAVTTYVNPFLVDAEPKGDPTIRNLYAEAREAGHLVQDADGEAYLLDQGGFDAALVDLTNPEARAWYAGVIAEEVLGTGAVGFMADFGEGLPFDAVLHDGDASTRHNEWPRLWSQTVREACEIAGQPECLTWMRSGSLGMSDQLAWNGDQLVDLGDEDGLASALLGTFSAGVSGWPLLHSDIGGYTSIDAVVKDYVRSPELLRRWAEMQAFGVLMRTHEGNRPDANRQVYDDDERTAFARMTQVYAALAPYRSEVLAETAETGMPAVRHGWLVDPASRAAASDTQFFLGDSVLVAPVLEEGADEVEVAFPEGEWVHLFTGETYGDDVATVAAPLGQPAAFVRADHPLADDLVAALSAL